MIGRAGSEWSEGVEGLEGYRVVWGRALSGWNVARIYEVHQSSADRSKERRVVS